MHIYIYHTYSTLAHIISISYRYIIHQCSIDPTPESNLQQKNCPFPRSTLHRVQLEGHHLLRKGPPVHAPLPFFLFSKLELELVVKKQQSPIISSYDQLFVCSKNQIPASFVFEFCHCLTLFCFFFHQESCHEPNRFTRPNRLVVWTQVAVAEVARDIQQQLRAP